MTTIELDKAFKPLADYAASLGARTLVATSNMRLVAALVPLHNVEREDLSLSLWRSSVVPAPKGKEAISTPGADQAGDTPESPASEEACVQKALDSAAPLTG